MKGTATSPKLCTAPAGKPVNVPAVGPRLKVVLVVVLAGFGLLAATGVYLLAIDLLERACGAASTNQLTLWTFLVHVLSGVLLIPPFLSFGLIHLTAARCRPNRRAVRWGVALFLTGLLVGLTGLALIQLDVSLRLFSGVVRMPQLPAGSRARSVIYWLHALAPLTAVFLYVMHRRAGPAVHWKSGAGWGLAVGAAVLVLGVTHGHEPRRGLVQDSLEGENAFEPSPTRTVDGRRIPAETLMTDHYCLECHRDVYDQWLHSAHHFSSFNNPAYLFSVRETRRVVLARDGDVRAARWCAGCHDPVPLLSGQFDDPAYDDVHHPTAQAGITCTVCHAMVDVNRRTGNGDYTIAEPLHYPFATSDSPVLQWLNHQLVKARPSFHKQTFLKPLHRSETFCATCHKVSLPMALTHYKEYLRGQDHADTFLLSAVSGHGARGFYYPPEAKTTCASCHMPLTASADFGARDFDDSGVRKVHHHLFPGANTALPWLLARDPRYAAHRDGLANAVQAHAAFLRGADPYGLGPKLRIDLFGLKAGGTTAGRLIAPLRPHLPELLPGQAYLVEVVIRNLAVGHPFTQGTADSNEVWVECTAHSGGRVIGQSGALDEGRVDEWAHFVNMLMLDRHGRRIDRRNPQDIFTPLYDHQVPAGAAQVVHYRLDLPPDLREPVELHVRLRYRKFDRTYLERIYGPDRVPPLPIVDLGEDRVTLPVAGGGAAPAQTSPITPAWQRWNDYGIGCLLEGGPDAKKGELRQAEEVFRYLTAGGDREAHGPAFLNLARVYQAEGRLGEAADALNLARTADPPAPWWTVAWLTGLVNAQNGHLEAAVAAFEQVLDPTWQPRGRRFDFTQDYQVINDLGKTLFALAQRQGEPLAARDRWLRRAVATFERTLAINPEDVDAHYGLAQCYSRLGEAAPVPASDPGAPPPEDDPLRAVGAVLANEQAPRGERLVAAFQLSRALPDLGRRPPDPRHPKLPVLQKLRENCLVVYRSPNDPGLSAAAALALGELHRLAHAIYKPDETARGQVMAVYRKAHPAAAAASEPIVVYRLR